jgi:phage tail-like protein
MTDRTSRYLEYLPAIYSELPFLGRFLAPFEEVQAGFDALLSEIDLYFDPAHTDADFLPWLATWVALVLDDQWDEAKRRQLIAEAVELYRWRGTVYGLKRYLEIYTGRVPEIREWRWPAGLQVGISSQVGGADPPFSFALEVTRLERREPPVYFNYYVVNIPHDGPPRELEQIYYRADRVEKVEIGDMFVDLWVFPAGGGAAVKTHHEDATAARRDGLIDERYTLHTGPDGTVTFCGDTFLVDEVREERPYRFIVDVRVPLADIEAVQLDKVRAILDLEKPAHTVYCLKLTPIVTEKELRAMQVQVPSRCDVGLTTTVG